MSLLFDHAFQASTFSLIIHHGNNESLSFEFQKMNYREYVLGILAQITTFLPLFAV